MDLSKIIEELRALRMEVVALQGQGPRSKAVQKTKCLGMTGKGTSCCNGAVLGTDFCKMHTDMVEKPLKVVKVPKTPKAKKIQPEHTHDIGGEVGDCELCQMHGDVVDPELPYLEFEGDLGEFENFLNNEVEPEDEYISDLDDVDINEYDMDEEDMGDMLKRLLVKHGGGVCEEERVDDVSERLRMLLESED
jgi:hypothetical protein